MSPLSRLLSLVVMLTPIPALAHGDLQQQIIELTEQIQQRPKDAMLYHKRGELCRAQGHWAEALSDYDAAEYLNPKLNVIHLSRGRALLESGKYERAEAELAVFLRSEPNHAHALLLRARTRAHLKQYREADADFALGISHTEKPTPDLFIERADNLRVAGDQAGALTVISAAISQIGSIVTLEHTALNLELKLLRFDDALVRINAMLAKAPRKEFLLAERGRVLALAGRGEESRQSYEESLAALDSLSPHQRKQQAIKQLEASIQTSLARTVTTPAQ